MQREKHRGAAAGGEWKRERERERTPSNQRRELQPHGGRRWAADQRSNMSETASLMDPRSGKRLKMKNSVVTY